MQSDDEDVSLWFELIIEPLYYLHPLEREQCNFNLIFNYDTHEIPIKKVFAHCIQNVKEFADL